MSTLSGQQVADAGLTDWSYLLRGLQTRLLTGDFATGLRLVEQIGAAAEAADHHPDLDLRYPYLDVRTSSHDVGGVTERDLRLARRISELAAAEGVRADPRATKQLELALDTPDAEGVVAFWSAVLDMSERRSDDDVDLHDDVLPNVWFQASGSQEPRQRFHLDLWVPPEVVEERIAAALAAGGVLVSDEEAPSFWVLADAEDNRVCLCTWQDRA
ncbi:4a-hydroxytetrahydrobiopterin dehydratase [Solicola sp. PLA-1-18]|uniref:4a-hydroxytetrahydrobiopterin dehydratase n=1 Tax=Solicola sp. PLA-1-18 TaxID=3380532 RepID=UPI003B764B17